MKVCSRLDLFQTGTTSTPSLASSWKARELRLGLMGKAVADAEGEFFEVEHGDQFAAEVAVWEWRELTDACPFLTCSP